MCSSRACQAGFCKERTIGTNHCGYYYCTRCHLMEWSSVVMQRQEGGVDLCVCGVVVSGCVVVVILIFEF